MRVVRAAAGGEPPGRGELDDGWVVRREGDEGGEPVAWLAVDQRAPAVLGVGVGVGSGVVDRSDSAELLDALEVFAAECGRSRVRVNVTHDLVRYVARGRGYVGGLRARLTGDARGAPATSATVGGSEEEVVRVAGELLAGRPLAASRPLGLRPRLELTLADGRLAHPVSIRMPARDDLMPESVAALLDTADGVLRRFPIAVHRISCEKASWGMMHGRQSGAAHQGLAIYLHPSYVVAEEREHQLREARGRPAPVRYSGAVPPPYLQADGTMAHELWHVIEASSHGPRPLGGVEFHQRLGEALGVETLEHALRGGTPSAPPEWRAARERLVAEVSPYAATDPREAKAEMFKLWWCRSGTPTPLVARFGELVDEFAPAAERAS